MSNNRNRDNQRAGMEEQRESRGRIPLGAPQLKLQVRDYEGQLQGYVPRWINDEADRINAALNGGYEPVFKTDKLKAGQSGEDLNSDIGSWVSKVVDRHQDGTPKRAYLMKIKREWYEADQQAKQKEVDAVDEAIRGGLINQKADDNRYVDKSRTNISL